MIKTQSKRLSINLMLCMIVGMMAMASSYADNVIDNPALLYMAPLPDDSILSQKITIKHTFKSIDEFAGRLNSISGISATVKNQSANFAQPVPVVLNNGTISELLNNVSKKFGYSWSWDGGVIVLTALTPRVSKTAVKALPNEYSDTVKASTVAMEWQLEPHDRTLRNALTRWCKKSGWQLIWNVSADYPIITSWNINGTFETAINEVLKASQTTNIPLLATMHDENKVLEIYSVNYSNKGN